MPVALAENSNPFLTAAMAAVNRARPLYGTDKPFDVRFEALPWGRYAQLWFLTGGCSWDACTMCNYGRGPRVDAPTMIEAVARGVARLHEQHVDILLVSPSGSFLDPREVPLEARCGILALMRDAPIPVVEFETRAETVTEEAVAQVAELLRGKMVHVNLGLESANPWVQRFCVNKGSSPQRFVDAAAILRRHDIFVIANISLGTAFLTPREAIADTVATVRWALDHGADSAVVYPLQVKKHTVLATLTDLRLHRATSLWGLVEALAQLGEEYYARTPIAWYRNYYNDTFRETVTTCPRCEARVLRLLDGYRAAQSVESMAPLLSYRCSCRERWRAQLDEPARPPVERIIDGYDRVAVALGLEAMWATQRHGLIEAMTAQFVPPGELGPAKAA